ncbi:hypothetical protein KAU40_00595 [Candidatus Parcubacteria bacterium]|nr:hypothetical protein [Candidatus Parcubacteria bacterium]
MAWDWSWLSWVESKEFKIKEDDENFLKIKEELGIEEIYTWTEENIIRSPELITFTDHELEKILNEKIGSEVSDLTYGVAILDILYERDIVDALPGSSWHQKKYIDIYFENMSNINFWAKEGQFTAEKFLGECSGVIGSTILMIPDLLEAGVSFKMLSKTFKSKVYWHYFQECSQGIDSDNTFMIGIEVGCYPVGGLPRIYLDSAGNLNEKGKKTKEYLEKLWNQYGEGYDSDSRKGGLTKEFKFQHKKELTEILIFAIKELREEKKFLPLPTWEEIEKPKSAEDKDSETASLVLPSVIEEIAEQGEKEQAKEEKKPPAKEKDILSGKYVSIVDEDDFVELYKDKTFYTPESFSYSMKAYGMEYGAEAKYEFFGKYNIRDNNIFFKYNKVKIESGGFEIETDLFGVSINCTLSLDGFDCPDGSQYRKYEKDEFIEQGEKEPREEKTEGSGVGESVLLKYRLCSPMNQKKEKVDSQIEVSLGTWIDKNLGLKMRWISCRENEGIWSSGYLDIEDHTVIGEHLWVVGTIEGGDGLIFYSRDGGISWELQWNEPHKMFGGSYPFVVYFLNITEGWVGMKGDFFYTKNGGKNWISNDVPNEGSYIKEYWFYNDQRIVAKTAYGNIVCESVNGGENWECDP